MKTILTLACCLGTFAVAAPPRDALPLDAPSLPDDYRLHVEFSEPEGGEVRLGENVAVALRDGVKHDVAVEYPTGETAVMRVWTDAKLVRGPEPVDGLWGMAARDFPEAHVDLSENFTVAIHFQSTGQGTLFSKCAAEGGWGKNAKALFLREGRLFFEIGEVAGLSGGEGLNDGKPHRVVVVSREGVVRILVDGHQVAGRDRLKAPDEAGHVLKLGRAAGGFGGDFGKGRIMTARAWSRALPDDELMEIMKGEGKGANTPDFDYQEETWVQRPIIEPAAGVEVKSAWMQALERSDHAEIVESWGAESLREGKAIYESLCVVCHGTKEAPGSLPTALRFSEGVFKNGSDPYSMWQTLSKGYGQMVAQPQYTTAQQYAVIHYIRESFLRADNPSQFTEITEDYLTTLPKARARAEKEHEDRSRPQHERMDLGPALFWTLQVAPGNIAQKAIAIRLDEGPGGVSKGRAWMVYDHDTMRVAAATTGDFVDWKGIAFDGSHGTHTSLTGDRTFVNPLGPGWASPSGSWEDDRLIGKDGLRYGPLDSSWAKYKGLYLNAGRAVISAEIGGVAVLESPGWVSYGATPVFTRTLNVAPSRKTLEMRVAPDTVNVVLTGDGTLRQDGGFWVASLPGGAASRVFISAADGDSIRALADSNKESLDLTVLREGGKSIWAEEVTTTSVVGDAKDAFVADTFPLPVGNPWQSWLRPGGFDFTPDGKGAVVAMWNGDVWRVDGIMEPAPATLRWRRIAGGLFQPLGVKFRGDELFIACRDQIARLHDFNGDGETDFIECFNNDHQVTEHFHEFAMGLQTDKDGNFYYAKSGRHALDSVVPQHGTLLKVSADGKKTEILATGFRAANGVCLNEDGSFFVTDQEGFWTPKNRINRVVRGGFYGNMYGYSDVTDTSDDAMEQPMVWMTNDKDRSPAELLKVPETSWGNLGGSLLNLSYGTGRAFIVPHEEVDGQWQGAVCELPMPAFPTGIMRGRFGDDSALYTCGMFAWAGNATSPGGFYRIRRSGQPAYVPLEIHASSGMLRVSFSEPLAKSSVVPEAFEMKAWQLKRSKNYGSPHVDEHPVEIAGVSLSPDGREVSLEIPLLEPTQCYELKTRIKGADGVPVERSIHGTIHVLAK